MKSNRNTLYIIFVISILVTLGVLIYFYIKGIKNERLYKPIYNNSSNTSHHNTSHHNTGHHNTKVINTNLQDSESDKFDTYNHNIPYTNVDPYRYTQQPVIIGQSQENLALERVYNPLKYPYKSPPFYNQKWYPNQMLPPQVIGCGARNTPCMGGTQIPIANPMPPIDISDRNIAPVNISTRGPLGQPQQVGAIYRVMGNENTVYPLFGRKKYPNGDKWEYYTTIGQYGVKMPVITQRKNTELGTNEIVFIQGQRKAPYRVTMYENDTPEYIPYI